MSFFAYLYVKIGVVKGSSTKSGTWNRDLRTGIPVPVGLLPRGSFRRKHAKNHSTGLAYK